MRSPDKNITFRRKLTPVPTQSTLDSPTGSSLENKVDKLMEMVSRLPELLDTVTKLVSELQSVTNKLKSVESENKWLKDELCDIKKKVNTINQPEFALDTVCREITDRERRIKNIIIFNIPETNDDGMNDFQLVSGVINENKAGVKIAQVTRLGKRPTKKPRPLKVTCDSQQGAFALFQLRYKVPDPWKMSLDRTPAQREQLSKVRMELEQRKKGGENDITIKFVQGIPTIVSTNNSSKNF